MKLPRRVRVVLRNESLGGTLLSYSDEALLIDVNGTERKIPAGEVTNIYLSISS